MTLPFVGGTAYPPTYVVPDSPPSSVLQPTYGEPMPTVTIQVYVCPTKGCGNYYGTKSIESLDLHNQFTRPRVEDRAAYEQAHGTQYRHTRAECPDCRQRGVKVERALVFIEVNLPDDNTPTPVPPGSNDLSRGGDPSGARE